MAKFLCGIRKYPVLALPHHNHGYFCNLFLKVFEFEMKAPRTHTPYFSPAIVAGIEPRSALKLSVPKPALRWSVRGRRAHPVPAQRPKLLFRQRARVDPNGQNR
jgi:hypothetical protein